MQDNYFFREPSIQKEMLDILFIYSKLNPDNGYRQGMHELLAPLLWVVHQDALGYKTPPLRSEATLEGKHQLMHDALNVNYIEHDAFSLFCAVMQTAKSFYELGDPKSPSPLVVRSYHIHEEVLGELDSELAEHLQVIEVLPQIYLMYFKDSHDHEFRC